MAKTALLLGASGLVGGHCLRQLLEHPSYSKIIVWARRTLPLQHVKLQQVVVDFDRIGDGKYDLKGVDELFCCLGTTMKIAGSAEAFHKVDFTYPYEAARLAARDEVSQYLIVTAMGADAGSVFYYNRVKGEIENELAKLPLHGVQILRPALLLGQRREFRLGEKIGIFAYNMLAFLFVGLLAKYRAIEASAVARAMIHIAQQNISGVNIFESSQLQSLATVAARHPEINE